MIIQIIHIFIISVGRIFSNFWKLNTLNSQADITSIKADLDLIESSNQSFLTVLHTMELLMQALLIVG